MASVLLVDDDPALLDVIALAFGEAGHAARTAADGLAALDAIRASQPDVLVADVNMPRLDGFSLCRRLREAGDATPIILLTSRDGEIDEALGLELGADDYVTKPFSMRVLVLRVSALLRREAARAVVSAPGARLTVGPLVLDTERLSHSWRRRSRARTRWRSWWRTPRTRTA
jgi:two-component system OmpR family response regulator/two-component system response regulator ChvI